MLQRFELRNFKAFRQQLFDLAPITVFVGRNGTGKSSVLQALAFLKQSSLRGEAAYVGYPEAPVLAELGSFEEIVHLGDNTLPIELRVKAQLDSLGNASWPALGWRNIGGLPIELNYQCELFGNRTPEEKIRVKPSRGPVYEMSRETNINRPVEDIRIVTHTTRYFSGFYVEVSGTGIALNSLAGSGIQDPSNSDLSQELNRLGQSLSIQLKRFFFVPAGRGFIGQTFPLQDDASDDLSTAMGYSEFASNAATRLAMARGLEEQVSDWLQQVTGLRIRAEIGKGKMVNVTFQPPRHVSERMAVGANNESFGANQLSHVFLQIALAGDEATIGIEEPEVHLHPRAQRALVETLARIAKDGSRQFIISTHSERVVSRLLVLVTKGVLRPEDLAVYAFDKDEEGVASAKACEVDENGQVAGGIPGFFEESIEDMSDVVAALSGSQG